MRWLKTLARQQQQPLAIVERAKPTTCNDSTTPPSPLWGLFSFVMANGVISAPVGVAVVVVGVRVGVGVAAILVAMFRRRK